MVTSPRQRNLKGSIFVELVKFLRDFQKSRRLPPLSLAAQELLTSRVLGSEWYPLEPFLELLALTDTIYLKGKESRALEMGAAGAVNQLRGMYKGYIKEGDPKASVFALRHAWRAHYDFAELSAEIQDDEVQFVLSGYENLAMPHALMVASWGVAGARLCGVAHAHAEVLERPWQGDSRFRYRIRF